MAASCELHSLSPTPAFSLCFMFPHSPSHSHSHLHSNSHPHSPTPAAHSFPLFPTGTNSLHITFASTSGRGVGYSQRSSGGFNSHANSGRTVSDPHTRSGNQGQGGLGERDGDCEDEFEYEEDVYGEPSPFSVSLTHLFCLSFCLCVNSFFLVVCGFSL